MPTVARPVMAGFIIGLRKRRLLVGIAICLIAYIFIKHLPTDVPRVADRYDTRTGLYQGRYHPKPLPSEEGTVAPSNIEYHDTISTDLYDGPVKFDTLALSLRANMYSTSQGKDNVVFVIHNLKTASAMLSLACNMASKHRSIVHVVIMSLSDASIDSIMQINGAAQMDCPVHVHDARPDHNMNSTPSRRVAAVQSAIGYIKGILAPTLMFTDARREEDPVFCNVLHERAESLRLPVKTLLPGAANALNWITNLDTSSLAHLGSVEVQILIQAPADSAASLIKLLRCIQEANYDGLTFPSIVIELPAKVDSFVAQFLKDFTWPPNSYESGSKLVIRRRIDPKPISKGSETLHVLESFYPATASETHVLILNPSVELSPYYYHYLMYTLLEYKYTSMKSSVHERLFGISLELPQKSLNERHPLYKHNEESFGPLILSQRPAGNAALYFGDRWIEFHQFMSKRLEHDPDLSKIVVERSTDIAQQHPLWIRHALEFMEIRGLFMMYPAFAADERFRLASIWQGLDGANEDKGHELHKEESMSELESFQSLLENLFSQSHATTGPLPRDVEMPLFSLEGNALGLRELQTGAMNIADKFSLNFGGCSSLEERDNHVYESIDYLFCDPD